MAHSGAVLDITVRTEWHSKLKFKSGRSSTENKSVRESDGSVKMKVREITAGMTLGINEAESAASL